MPRQKDSPMAPERVISISISEADWKTLRSIQPEPVDWLKDKIRETVEQARKSVAAQRARKARRRRRRRRITDAPAPLLAPDAISRRQSRRAVFASRN